MYLSSKNTLISKLSGFSILDKLFLMVSLIRKVVIDSESRAGRLFDIFIQLLIILSLISFSIETIPNLSKEFKQSND